VGSIGRINAFSFCQDKIMTTGGEGGMVTTDDAALWSRAWSFRDHGKSYAAVQQQESSSGFRWLHESFGTNWRLTEMQSALGRLMLRNLDASVGRRRQLADTMNQALQTIPALRTTLPANDAFHSYYKYYVFIRPDELRADWNRDRIMTAIEAEGVPCFSGACSEIYLEKAFDGIRQARRLPVAQELGETSLMLLLHPPLSDQDVQDSISAVRKVVEHASR